MSSNEKKSFDSIFSNTVTKCKKDSLTQEDVASLIKKHKTDQQRKNKHRKRMDYLLLISFLCFIPASLLHNLVQGLIVISITIFFGVHIYLYSRFHKKLEQQDKSTTYQEYLNLRKVILERGLKELQVFRVSGYYVFIPIGIIFNLYIGFKSFDLKEMVLLLVILSGATAWVIYNLETGIKEFQVQLDALE